VPRVDTRILHHRSYKGPKSRAFTEYYILDDPLFLSPYYLTTLVVPTTPPPHTKPHILGTLCINTVQHIVPIVVTMESKNDDVKNGGTEVEPATTSTATTTTSIVKNHPKEEEGEKSSSIADPTRPHHHMKEGTEIHNSRRNNNHDDDDNKNNNEEDNDNDDDDDEGGAPNGADADDYKAEDDVGPTLQVEIQNSDDTPEMEEEEEEGAVDDDEEEDGDDVSMVDRSTTKDPSTEMGPGKRPGTKDREEQELLETRLEDTTTDPKTLEQIEYINNHTPGSDLEIALAAILERKEAHVQRLMNEIYRFRAFISKRKQVYKRKRKDNGAPTRALSAYNIYVQDRFLKLAQENEVALKSTDSNAQLKRVPPANLVASTGNAWRDLSAEDKAKYEERAKSDRKRYEEQMTKYQPPDKQANRKRNKTGYNMFFSAHVLRLKQSELGVPSERGSVARLVGNAWKVCVCQCLRWLLSLSLLCVLLCVDIRLQPWIASLCLSNILSLRCLAPISTLPLSL
jgi:hypothetical protein